MKKYSLVGAVPLSGLVVLALPLYVEIYQVEPAVKDLPRQRLAVYALAHL